MVDFDNEATIGTPSIDIMRVLFIQWSVYTTDALEKIRSQEAQGTELRALPVFKSRLYTYWDKCRSILKRHIKEEQFKEYQEKLKSNELNDLMEVYYLLEDTLDKIQLTRVDTKKDIDFTRVIRVNRLKGH